jgi:hypothetical protein
VDEYRYKVGQRQHLPGADFMSDDKETLETEDDFITVDSEEVEPVVETTKSNLSKRRTIDNLLEERRLQRRLADYDFDL